MPLKEREKQALIDCLETYPPWHGRVWGTGPLETEDAYVAAAMLEKGLDVSGG